MKYRPIWSPQNFMPPEPPEWVAGQQHSYRQYWACRISGSKEDTGQRAVEAEAEPLPPVSEKYQEGSR